MTPGGGLLASLAALTLAAEAVPAVDPTGIAGYLSYGPLGLMVVGFLTGHIVPGQQAKRDAAENTRLRTVVEEVIPLMRENTAVTRQMAELVRDLQVGRGSARDRESGG